MLEVLPTPDGINYDHADWAEAQIEMNSGKPLAVPDCELIEIPTRNLQLVVRVDKNKNVFQQYFGERGGLEKIFSAGVPMTPLYPTFSVAGIILTAQNRRCTLSTQTVT